MSLIQKVKIGDRVLVETASYIMPPDSQTIEFTLSDNKKINFRFIDNKEKKEISYEAGPSQDGQSYNMDLVNFSNILGEGLETPVPFYRSNDIQHYLMLWAETNNNKGRILTITITRDS